MKYFSKAHQEALQVVKDEDYDEFSKAWDARGEAYEKYLESIDIPKGLQKFRNECYPHDSKFVDISKEGDILKLKLKLCWKTEFSEYVTLSFKLSKDIEINPKFIGAYWIYEELEMQPDNTGKYEILVRIPNSPRSINEEFCIYFTDVTCEF